VRHKSALVALLLLGLAQPVQAGDGNTRHATIGEAARQAFLLGCNLHSIGAINLDASGATALAEAGLIVTSDVPDRLKSGASASWGSPTYAKVESLEGNVWLTAFPNRLCRIYAPGGDVSQTKKILLDEFTAEGVPWQQTETKKIPSINATSTRFIWNFQQNIRLVLDFVSPDDLSKTHSNSVIIMMAPESSE